MSTSSAVPALEVTRIRFVARSIFAAARTRFSSAVSGNFLFSTGANEFAGRYTAGHFDLPMMGTTIELDGLVVVREGVLQDVFG